MCVEHDKPIRIKSHKNPQAFIKSNSHTRNSFSFLNDFVYTTINSSSYFHDADNDEGEQKKNHVEREKLKKVIIKSKHHKNEMVLPKHLAVD